ncbi:MAG: DNA translocase FtsK, partial [Lachnospiraceae bacterium]|nr:DNA translocase FtsK [Lachnospiraceae bacterium]
NELPHLLLPVISRPEQGIGAVNWAVQEMERRYKAFKELNKDIKDLSAYNLFVRKVKSELVSPSQTHLSEMPQIVLIIHELYDLITADRYSIENSIVKLSQYGSKAGIHIIVATSIPTPSVVTRNIEASIPSRISLLVNSTADSRRIIKCSGAEYITINGEMLVLPKGISVPIRARGCYISTEDLKTVPQKDFASISDINYFSNSDYQPILSDEEEYDELIWDAGEIIIDKEKASIGMLQRVLKIGFNRAARIMDQLEELGVVGEENDAKPRKVLMNVKEFHALKEGEIC